METKRKTYDELISTSASEKEFTDWIINGTESDLFHIVHRLQPHQPYRQLADRVLDLRIAQHGGKNAKLAIGISVVSVAISLYAAIKPSKPIIVVQPQAQLTNSTPGSAAIAPPVKE
jgi:hypothetical protein